MANMALAQALRKQQIHWLAKEFLKRIPKELGNGGVGLEDDAVIIDDEQRIG